MANSLSVIKTSKEDYMPLERVLYIYYLLHFWKDIVGIRALINSNSEINAITPMYVSKLGLKIYHTDVEAQKIYGSTLKMFKIVLASFSIEDKISRAWFFQKNFLLANISAEIVLDMLFLTLSNTNV